MLIVTPNPAVDRTVRLATLRPGEVIRTRVGRSAAGGKGANVARAARCLGAPGTVLAFVPRSGGAYLESLYAVEGLALVAVPVAGAVRTCTALLEDAGRVTLLNEPGPALADGDWDRLMAALREALSAGVRAPGPVVCSGSLPPGAPVGGYARVVLAGHDAGREVAVDSSGEPLALAVAAGADLVCPNLSEAERTISAMTAQAPVPGTSAGPRASSPAPVDAEKVHDGGDDVPGRAAAAAAALHGMGAAWAVVTAGAAGAAVCGPGTARWLPAPAASVRNPIGAGDSFLAGVVAARQSGRDWLGATRRGLAAGSASVEQEAAGVLDPARVDQLERDLGGH